jgi:folate-binding protein YgfZ
MALAEDHRVLTEGCGLFDRSERGKLALAGPDAKAFLQGQVTNDIEALGPGTGCYAAFLTPKGKMLGDLRILDAGDELLLDTERVALQELFNMIRTFSIGFDVELRKRTLERGLLSLIGPRSDAVARAAVAAAAGGREAVELPVNVPGAVEHAHVELAIGSSAEPVRVIKTDVGLDLLSESERLAGVRAALLDAGATAVGEEAVECLRIERGRPRFGVDLDDTVMPQEAGLNDRAVSFTKGCYVGQETVARLFYRGKPNRRLCGLRCDELLAPGATIAYGEKPAGRVTSTADSPRLGPIALAFVRREAPLGAHVSLTSSGEAEVVELPFV